MFYLILSLSRSTPFLATRDPGSKFGQSVSTHAVLLAFLASCQKEYVVVICVAARWNCYTKIAKAVWNPSLIWPPRLLDIYSFFHSFMTVRSEGHMDSELCGTRG